MSSCAPLIIDAAALGLTVAATVRRHLHRHRMATTMGAAASALSERAAPPVAAVFIDCDDCMFQNNWATANRLTDSIAAYTTKLGVSKDEAYSLYKKHGTCLRGLLAEGRIGPGGVEEYLRAAHDISYEDISPDPPLRAELAHITPPMWVFTASTSEHASRCMERLGLAGLPWRGVIDTRSCGLETKHSRSSFEAAMRIAGVSDPAACVFCDDSVKNIVAASAFGWRTVLIGLHDRDSGKPLRCDAADFHLASLHGLRGVLPELFTPKA